ncbi:MAG: signal peptidase I [Methanobacteriaceae archaeon]|nr:signal peptidase I [Methanobacteriaceae archaeon]
MTDKKEIICYVVLLIVVLLAASHLNVVVSGSMEPVFYRGDIVVVEKADFFGIHEFDPNDVQVGDIVVYNAVWYNNPVIHRVINITEINGTTMYMIKGDNNDRPDPYYVTADQIRDRVLTFGDSPIVIPKIGYVTIVLKGL